MTSLRKLIDLIRSRDRRTLILLTAGMALGSVFEALGIGLIVPYLNAVTNPDEILSHDVAGRIFGSLGVTQPRQVLVVSSLLIVAVFVAKNGYIAWIWKRVYGFIYREYAHLAQRLLEGYLAVPYTFHLQRNTATLIRNATEETRRVLEGAVQSALEVLSEGLVIAGIVGVLAYVHTTAAAVVFIALAAGGWGLTSLYRAKLQKLGSTRAGSLSRMIQTVNEGLGGLKEIKVLGRKREVLGQFNRASDEVTAAEREYQVIGKYPRLFLETAAVAGMVGLAGLLVFTGVSLMDAIPVLGVFAVAAVRLMPSVNRVVNQVNSLRYQFASIEILHAELAAVEDARTSGKRPEPAASLSGWERLELADISYRYPDSDSNALEAVSLSVARGEHVGVVGPSGSGKTTLVDVILGLLEPDDGGIYLDDLDISDRLRAWQRSIGYIPQEIHLTDDSIRRNVAFGLAREQIEDDRVWRALEAAQLADFVTELSGQLDTVVGERGVRLSGGQRQRIAVARALYHDPEVLVLDEATASLDFETERRIMRAVNALAGEKTVVTVTHRLGSVRECDTVHVLEDGRLTGSGSYQELRRESQTFGRMMESQVE